MKDIAIIGAGAIGSVAAGLLTKAGKDVLLVGRPGHVDAINQNGLRIKGFGGEQVIKVRALTQMDKEHDLVIFCTKTTDLEEAYQSNHKFLDKGLVLTSQNGVQADTILGFHFDPQDMFSSIVMFGATYTAAGEVVYNFPGDWIIGKPYTALDPRVEEIAAELRCAFPVVVSPDIMGMKWLKVFVNMNNSIPALVGKSMQETFSDLDFCRLSVMLLREGVQTVQAAKVELVSLPNFPAERIYGMAAMPIEQAAGIINQTLTKLSKEPLYGSILQSIMRKRVSEIDFINGEIVQLAHGIRQQAPLNRKIVDMVHKVEREGKFLKAEEVKKEFEL